MNDHGHKAPRPNILRLAAAGLLTLSVSCSSPPGSGTAPGAAGAQASDVLTRSVLAADPAEATFRGRTSRKILAAAMTYPKAAIAVDPAPPLSLTASDGTGLELTRLQADAVVEGPLAFTELRLRFHNPLNRVIEGRFSITLPEGATISRLAMELPTGWQEAEVVEKQQARRAYEDFLHRRQDPALLEKEAGNQFRARVFPIPALADKNIIISYSQPLVREAAGPARYRLPLRGLPTIAELAVRVRIGEPETTRDRPATMRYREATLHKREEKPSGDFEVTVPRSVVGVAADQFVALPVHPRISTERQSMGSLLVLFDTSASRAPGFSAQVEALGELMTALTAAQGADTRVELAAFDQSVVPIYAGTLGGFGREQLDSVRAHRPLGASNLGAALAWAGTRKHRSRLLLVTDAIPTMGATGLSDLRQAVRALAPASQRLDIVLAGGIRDRDLAGQLVRGALARDGVVLSSDDRPARLVEKLGRATVSGVQVSIAGAEWVWPDTLDSLQANDEVLVFASLGQAKAGAAIKVAFSGPITHSERIPITHVAKPLIERAAMGAQIARLTMQRDRVAAEHKQDRARLAERIVELSTRYRVLSDLTALLVLETEDDYKRYGIDRTSLADILTVGERGVEVFQRQAPVLMIATPTAGASKSDAKAKDADKGSLEGLEQQEVLPSPDAARPAGDGDGFDEFEDEDDADVEIVVTGAAIERREIAEEAPSVADRVIPRPRPAGDRPAPSNAPARRPPPPPAAPSPEPDPEPESEPVLADEAETVASDSHGDRVRRVESMVRAETNLNGGGSQAAHSQPPRDPREEVGPPPYSGQMAKIMALLESGDTESATVQSIRWQSEHPGDVMALIALGESLERSGRQQLAARAYGSIIDLFPSRADLRRFAGQRLERLDAFGRALAADTYRKAVEQRPDHLTGHRLLAYALVRLGEYEQAFAALEAGIARRYPEGRFASGPRILREDLGLVAAAWLRVQPEQRPDVTQRLQVAGAALAEKPSLRFVLHWETDANDVDFHIYDGRGGHAYYRDKELPSGGQLYADITNGYGPECFTIEGVPQAYPYEMRIHYYSRGPMGYGMGKLHIVEHDGQGRLRLEDRPFVVMNDGAYVRLGTVDGTPQATIAH